MPVPAWCFGLGERTLVALELMTAAVLTAWAWRGCGCTTDLAPVTQLRDAAAEESVAA
jgi:hypothetical protein